jgi:antitoxin component YwqK of YwqJK toxin-antitoxin module
MKTETYEVIREYYDNGQIYSEGYYLDGILHNTNGPALKYWYDHGQIGSEKYYINGKYHNPNGPALKYWNEEDGKIRSECYFLNGIELTKEEFDNRTNPCNGKEVIIEGKKYKLIAV